MRSHLNRILLLVALAVALPAIALGERLRADAGRRLAVWAIKRVARCAASTSTFMAPNAWTTARPTSSCRTTPVRWTSPRCSSPAPMFASWPPRSCSASRCSAPRCVCSATIPITRGDPTEAHARVTALSRPESGRSSSCSPKAASPPPAKCSRSRQAPRHRHQQRSARRPCRHHRRVTRPAARRSPPPSPGHRPGSPPPRTHAHPGADHGQSNRPRRAHPRHRCADARQRPQNRRLTADRTSGASAAPDAAPWCR